MKEGLLTDPNDRDRQQRELTEELEHDAEMRAARKRLEEEQQRDAQTEELTAPADQRQPPGDQPRSADEIRDWAADVAPHTNGTAVAATTPRPR